MSLVCTICGKTWETIPQQAVLISGGSRVSVYDIDGEIHSLRHVMAARQKHNRWHKTKKTGCEFCFPLPEPPVERTELLNDVLEVLEELPQPEEVKPVPPSKVEPEDLEPEPRTAMAFAFQRSRVSGKRKT
jgi:hypothetical protein